MILASDHKSSSEQGPSYCSVYLPLSYSQTDAEGGREGKGEEGGKGKGERERERDGRREMKRQ